MSTPRTNPAQFSFVAANEQATDALGRALADALLGGVIALRGPLGAGKTRLVQAVAEAQGVDRRDVISPTFVLVHEYQGRRPIIHIDAYRLRDDDEFFQIGGPEYLNSPGLIFIEWAERVERCLPADRLDVQIEVVSPTTRRFELVGHGQRFVDSIEHVRAALTQCDPSAE